MTARVVVVGGGVIGLVAARQLAVAGHEVVLVDPAPGRGATWAAAGMLAPLSELEYGHETLFRLNRHAADTWADWAADLDADSDDGVGYEPSGSVLVARDRDDRARLDELATFAATLGHPMTSLRGSEVRRREPYLAPGIVGGLLAPDDHSVDPRRLVDALLHDLDARGVTLVASSVQRLDVDGATVTGVVTADDVLSADEVVVAAGIASRRLLAGLVDLPVRPVKGERLALRVRTGGATLQGVVRGHVHGSEVYLVPRPSGDVVVGATVLEVGEDTAVTAGGVWELLRDAREIVPGVTEWELCETIAGLRPGTPDNGPLLGRPDGVDGVVVATGHHRNGVLLAPVTGDTVVRVIDGSPLHPTVQAFAVDRFRTSEEVP